MILLIDTTKERLGKTCLDKLKDIIKCKADYEYINASEFKISHCHGCNFCWLKTPGECVVIDDYDHSLIQAQFSLNEEILAFPIRSELGEIDYKDNNPDLDERLKCILSNSRNILEITTSFEMQIRRRNPHG